MSSESNNDPSPEHTFWYELLQRLDGPIDLRPVDDEEMGRQLKEFESGRCRIPTGCTKDQMSKSILDEKRESSIVKKLPVLFLLLIALSVAWLGVSKYSEFMSKIDSKNEEVENELVVSPDFYPQKNVKAPDFLVERNPNGVEDNASPFLNSQENKAPATGFRAERNPIEIEEKDDVFVKETQLNLHWSQTIAVDTAHDFGAVAKASKQEHVFEFVNNLDCDLHLLEVRASAGGVGPTILTPVVKPGEKAQVHAKLDTLEFDGATKATLSISVRKDRPYTEYSELQLMVKGLIRRDVVLQPASVDFADVLTGKATQRILHVKYAGDPNWKIKEVKSSNENVTIEIKETRRDLTARRVDYDLKVTISGGGNAGQFTDSLTIVTNDQINHMLSVDMTGDVQSIIETTDIQLGQIAVLANVEKSMIIRGARPFKIEDIVVDNPAIKILGYEGEKSLHIVKYVLDTSKVRKIDEEIRIITNDPLQPEARLTISAQIMHGTTASNK